MELIPLNCNNCGAKLKVDEDTKFVTCKHCDAQLAVRHVDGAAFTNVIEAAARVEASAAAIERHVEKLGTDNERSFLQGEIERLDREWESRREDWMTRRKNGEQIAPTKRGAIALGFVAPLMFLPLAVPIALADISLPTIVWAVPLAFTVIILLACVRMYRDAEQYERALADHDAERAALVAKLQAVRDGNNPTRKKKKTTTKTRVG